MLSRFLRIGIAALGLTISPLAAQATVYEAVWQVQIVWADSYGLGHDFSRPASFEYKVRFSDEISLIPDEDGYLYDTIVYFKPEAIAHIRPAAIDNLPPRPEGYAQSAYNTFSALVADEEWEFSETIETTEQDIIQDGDLYWEHSTYLMSARYSEPRSGVGDDDYAFTSDGLISFLEEVMANPDAFKLEYVEYITHSIGTQGGYRASWVGNMQLTSLRALEATDVPEPPLMALIGTGLLSLALVGRRQRQWMATTC